ncbi:MAG: 3-deoxy-D-manno-octulosonic acid transferase, partial [Gammaproteobacteria bacterium]
MSEFLYRLALSLLRPLLPLRLYWRARREPDYGERRSERFGRIDSPVPAGAVWIHAVSAGETLAVGPLVDRMRATRPDLPVLITTMTPTGKDAVQTRFAGAVPHAYAPYDFPDAVARALDAVRPALLVLVETELWPNLIAAAHRRKIPVLLINARLSARSARGYRWGGRLVRRMMRRLEHVACQYPAHAARFAALGVPADRLSVTGSVKFDLTLPAGLDEHARALRQRLGLGSAPVWIAASTHPGEEALVLEAHHRVRQRIPDARLVLAPRHPQRATEVAALCRAAGFAVRLSGTDRALSGPSDDPHGTQQARDAQEAIVLVNAMGVLLPHYALADAAFVGGSLIPVGGHNPIEPALIGVPMMVGPHVHNFADVLAVLADPDFESPLAPASDPAFDPALDPGKGPAPNAVANVADPQTLADVVTFWLGRNPVVAAARTAAGERLMARACAASGASARTAALLLRH